MFIFPLKGRTMTAVFKIHYNEVNVHGIDLKKKQCISTILNFLLLSFNIQYFYIRSNKSKSFLTENTM